MQYETSEIQFFCFTECKVGYGEETGNRYVASVVNVPAKNKSTIMAFFNHVLDKNQSESSLPIHIGVSIILRTLPMCENYVGWREQLMSRGSWL